MIVEQSGDLRGQTYDQVDQYVKVSCDLPISLKWNDIRIARPLWGTIPQDKTNIIHDAILLGEKHRANTDVIGKELLHKYPYKYFRTAGSLQPIFQTEKGLWGHRFESRLIFITGSYSESSHLFNIRLFRRLADVWENGTLISITKDYTVDQASNECENPFVRPFAAILVVQLKDAGV